MSGYLFMPDDGGAIPRAASDAVLGGAARRVLGGYVPDGAEHDCCRIAVAHRRLCWHQAAVVLYGAGLRADPRPTDVVGNSGAGASAPLARLRDQLAQAQAAARWSGAEAAAAESARADAERAADGLRAVLADARHETAVAWEVADVARASAQAAWEVAAEGGPGGASGGAS